MRIEIYIDTETERPNAIAAANVVQNHPELADADEIQHRRGSPQQRGVDRLLKALRA